jgi:hypothetical protein
MSWANVIWEILLPILAERGYLIPAIDTESVDYLGCAVQLAHSIRQWHPDANISVITVRRSSDPVFDHVIPLPYGDLEGYANDWQCFDATPYRQTIKLEADMIMTSPFDHWWTLFEQRDVVISQGCRNIYNQPADSRYYRQLFDNNNLPDVYNAITYWRRSQVAQDFFRLVRTIFENWNDYRCLLKRPDDEPSTDVVYAIAAVLMGPELVTLPAGLGPSIVHMKQHIIATLTEDWTQELVWENANPGLRINTVAQSGAVHYHIKDWRIDG